MKKYTKEEINKMDAIDIYKLVLEQKHIKKIPSWFLATARSFRQCG